MALIRVPANGDLVPPVAVGAGGMCVADAGCGSVQYPGGTDAETLVPYTSVLGVGGRLSQLR